MKTEADARALAASLVAIGNASGVRTEAFLTAMDAPLGRAVGNASEVVESIETLKGRGPGDLEALSVTLAARMLVLARIAPDMKDAEALVWRALQSGEALECFRRMVAQQGGDPRIVDDYGLLPSAPGSHRVTAPRAGYVESLDAFLVGRASMLLGAGREKATDVIDPGVGISVHAKPGDRVSAGETVLELHHRTERGLNDAARMAASAVTIGDGPVTVPALIIDEIN